MKHISFGIGIDVPVEAATSTFAILAKRRVGKSNTAAVMAEAFYDAGIPFCVIDPKGDWWGLRGAGLHRRGLGIIIFGGHHADLPIEATGGEFLANLIAEKRLSCVLDVSEFSEGEKLRFLTDFALRLLRVNRDPLHLFLEEADDYIPQKPFREQARCVGAFQKLVKQGGFRGIGCTLISQRSAALSKNVLTQSETLIIHRTTSPQDRAAVKSWIDYQAVDPSILESMPSLADGEAWIASPHFFGLDKPVRVQFPRRGTFDSGDTPKVGGRTRAPKTLADVDIDAIREQMKEAVERQRADDPRELRARIAQLERELRGAPKATALPAPPKVVVKREVVADARLLKILESTTGKTEAAIATIRDMLAASEKVMVRLDAVGQRFRAGGDGQLTGKVTAEEFVRAGAPGLYLEGAAILGVRDGRVVVGPEARGRPSRVRLGPKSNVLGDARLDGPERSTAEVVTKEGLQEARSTQLLAGERRMLQAIAQRHPIRMTRSQVGTLAGFTPSGGTFKNYLGRLKKFGLIREERDDVEVTARGFAYLGDDVPRAPATTAELQELWRSKLLRGEREILDLLIGRYPDGMSREEIGQQAGFEASGGTFKNYLGTLKRNELAVERDGLVRASDTLFLERG